MVWPLVPSHSRGDNSRRTFAHHSSGAGRKAPAAVKGQRVMPFRPYNKSFDMLSRWLPTAAGAPGQYIYTAPPPLPPFSLSLSRALKLVQQKINGRQPAARNPINKGRAVRSCPVIRLLFFICWSSRGEPNQTKPNKQSGPI